MGSLLTFRLAVSEPGKEERSRSSSRSRSRSRERRRSRSRSPTRKHHGNRYRSSSWGRNRSNSPRRRRSYSRSRRHDEFGRRSPRRHRSRSPQNRGHLEEDEVVTDTFIRAVAGEIKGHDAKFEETLRGREKNNPKFAFIFRKDVSSTFIVFRCVYITIISIADTHIIEDSSSQIKHWIRNLTMRKVDISISFIPGLSWSNIRVIIRFIRLILGKSLNESEFVKIHLASWPVEGLNPCCEHCRAKEEK